MQSNHRTPAATALALVLALAAVPWPAAHADNFLETRLSEPAPDFDQPRRVVLQLTSDDARTMNNVLYNAVNIQKFYGMDNVEIAIIAYAAGMEALYAGSSPVQDRVSSLQQYGISFIGCGNTMEATDREPDELIEGVQWVEAGVAEIVERQLDGWVYVRP